MQLFLEAVPIILELFHKARGHLYYSQIIPGIICQSLPTVPLLEGQSRFLVQNLLLSHFFLSVPLFFYQINLSLNSIIFIKFVRMSRFQTNSPTFSGSLSRFLLQAGWQVWDQVSRKGRIKRSRPYLHLDHHHRWKLARLATL